MKCSICGKVIQENLPYPTYIWWKGKIAGACCYREVLKTLEVESITGDTSLRYNFDGVFIDSDKERYRIKQSVTAGPGNMGYALTLQIEPL